MAIKQPNTQVRLTNVAVVRSNIGGMRFELACYPNKVLDWRAGIESDLSEVLQTEHIYTNVSKGEFAKKEDLVKVFGNEEPTKIYTKILKTGIIQVNERERKQQQRTFLAELYHRVAEHLIVKTTQLRATPAMVEQAFREIRYFPKYNAQVFPKTLANQAANMLCAALPDTFQRTVMRATMVLKEEYTYENGKKFLVTELGARIISEDNQTRITFETAPGDFRKFESFCKSIGALMENVVMNEISKITDHSALKIPTEHAAPSSSSSSSESDEEEADVSSSEEEATLAAAAMGATEAKKGRRLMGFQALQESDGEEVDIATEEIAHEIDEEEKKAVEPAAEEDLANFETVADRRRRLRNKERQHLKRDHRERERVSEAAHQQPTSSSADSEPEVKPNIEGGCVVCGSAVPGNLRQHYREGWHIMNEKRRVRGLNPLNKEAFEDLSRDICEGFLAVE